MRSLSTDSARYEALRRRDPRAEGEFFYAVISTGVYCRPGCPARLPRQENVTYYDSAQAAERAGFRPCRRCRPREASESVRKRRLIEGLCRHLDAGDGKTALSELAERAELSPYYLHRLFRAHTGMTPREYEKARVLSRLQNRLERGSSVTEAIHAAGYSSSGRFYERESRSLGMQPSQAKRRGAGLTLNVAVRNCSLGCVLIAATHRGVCAIAFGKDEAAVRRELSERFSEARLRKGGKGFQQLVERVIRLIEGEPISGVPVDLMGTAFQRRVWRALRDIPRGTTLTYAELARRLGAPRAARAVGAACAENPLAVVVPCHRIVRGDGSPGGYRWGLSRKRALLSREREG